MPLKEWTKQEVINLATENAGKFLSGGGLLNVAQLENSAKIYGKYKIIYVKTYQTVYEELNKNMTPEMEIVAIAKRRGRARGLIDRPINDTYLKKMAHETVKEHKEYLDLYCKTYMEAAESSFKERMPGHVRLSFPKFILSEHCVMADSTSAVTNAAPAAPSVPMHYNFQMELPAKLIAPQQDNLNNSVDPADQAVRPVQQEGRRSGRKHALEGLPLNISYIAEAAQKFGGNAQQYINHLLFVYYQTQAVQAPKPMNKRPSPQKNMISQIIDVEESLDAPPAEGMNLPPSEHVQLPPLRIESGPLLPISTLLFMNIPLNHVQLPPLRREAEQILPPCSLLLSEFPSKSRPK